MLVSVSVTTLQGATLGSMGVRRAVQPAGCLKPGAGRELGSRPRARGLRGLAAASLRACASPGEPAWCGGVASLLQPAPSNSEPRAVRAAKRAERERCAGRRCVEARAHARPPQPNTLKYRT